MSDDEDPFEELDEAVEDRDGDPFDNLGYPDQEGPEEESPADEAEDSPEDTSGEEWSKLTSPDDEFVDSPSASEPEGPDESESAEHTPGDTSEMEFGIGRRESEGTPDAPSLGDIGTREGDPFESVQGAFEQMDTGGMNPDAVWQNLASAESRGSVGDVRERSYAEVSKHSYCEQCEHFSEPPDVHCTHEGTDIIEFLDMETVRVVDCPIVAEREELERS